MLDKMTREERRLLYCAMILQSVAYSCATDLKEELKGNKALWNNADDIERGFKRLDARFTKNFDSKFNEKYCNVVFDFESASEKKFEKLRSRCSHQASYSFLVFSLFVGIINDCAHSEIGTVFHRDMKTIRQDIDTRYLHLLKKLNLLPEVARLYKSDEYKEIVKFVNSKWHMERIYSKKKKHGTERKENN